MSSLRLTQIIFCLAVSTLFQSEAAGSSDESVVQETCDAYPKATNLGPILPGRPHLDVRFRATMEPGGNYFDVRGCGKNRHFKITLGPLGDGENGYTYNAIPLYKAGEFDLIAYVGDIEDEEFFVYSKTTGYRKALSVDGYAEFEIVDTDHDGVYVFRARGLGAKISFACPDTKSHKFTLKKSHTIYIHPNTACIRK